ncbi:MAG: ABC transporter permease [Candidatus Fimenecus sp.]
MRKTSFLSKLINAPYIVWSVLFIVAPMIMVVYYAFTDRSGAFTWNNITALTAYKETFARSIGYAVAATVICLLLAYPLAYIMARSKASKQRTLMMLVMLPMWMNFLIRTYSWISILSNTGIINHLLKAVGLPTVQMINTPGAVILGMVYNFLPYMVLPIYSIMSKLDYSLTEAAQDLGCSSTSVLRRVIMPLSMPGVVSGITMVFVPSVSTFYISQKLGGGKFLLVGDSIEMQFQSAYNYNLGASLSLVLMLMIIVCMLVMNRFADDDEEAILI